MGSIDKERLNMLAAEVRGSNLPKPVQDAWCDTILLASKAANGSQDKVGDLTSAFLSFVSTTARDATYRQEELASLIGRAFEAHKLICPAQNMALTVGEEVRKQMYACGISPWDGTERRQRQDEKPPEPMVTAKTKWFDLKATGKLGMDPIIRITKIICYSAVVIVGIYQASSIMAQLKENKAMMARIEKEMGK